MKFGTPLALPAQSFTPGQTDLLSANIGQSGAGNVIQVTVSGPNAYRALLFVCGGTTRTFYCAEVTSADQPATRMRVWSAAAHETSFEGTNVLQQCIVPVQSNPGESLDVECFFNGVNSDAVAVYGLTVDPGISVRSDGRAYPIGRFFASSFNSTAGNTTLIAAPGAGLRLLLASIWGGTTTTTGPLLITVHGVVSLGPIESVAAFQGASPVPPGGLLLDTNTAVLMQGSTGTTAGAISYDIVPQ